MTTSNRQDSILHIQADHTISIALSSSTESNEDPIETNLDIDQTPDLLMGVSEDSDETKDSKESKDSSTSERSDTSTVFGSVALGSIATNLTKTGKAIKGAADRTAKNIRDTADDVTVRTIAVVKTVVPVATDALNVILPKYEPLPHDTFLSLAFACSIPAILYILGFTKMGYGVQVYQFLSTRVEHHSYLIGLGLAGFTFLLYLLDVQYWKSFCGKWIRRSLYGFVVVGTTSLLLGISGEHPYGPISIYLVLSTLWLTAIKHTFFRNMATRKYVSWLSGPLFCTSMLIFLSWFIWTFWRDENEWTTSIRLLDASSTGCDADFTDRESCRGDQVGGVCFKPNGPASVYFPPGCDLNCRDVYSSCLNTFIIWAGPFLVSAGLLFLSFFTTFVGGRVSAEEEIIKFTKIWLFLLFGMWVTASLAGAGPGFTFALAAITLAAFVASGVFIASSYKRIEREERIKTLWDTIVEKYGSYLNIIRGLLVVTCTPVALAYVLVSGLKQRVRSLKCVTCSQPPQSTRNMAKPDKMKGWLTIEGRDLVREFRSWDRASVYSWSLFWGVGFMTLSVLASKFTTLFLSWLINATQHMSLVVVTSIMVGVGVLMFLLPPVPGAPIYLTMGIVIIPVGSETLGLVWSIVYAMAVSTFLKLLATALQQKMIGGLLMNQVGVRQLVGVNTSVIRAMKLLLKEPGLSIPKVAILCGGPDWPTSVLCGIMGLPLIPNLIGTLPVIALVVPTVLAGSFTYMAGIENDTGNSIYPWAGVGATISIAIATLVLFGNILLAAYYVEQTVSTRQDELDAIPIDEEVRIKEDAEESFRKAYEEVTKWKEIPLIMNLILTLSVACMIGCCYLVQLFSMDCFVPYKLTDTIAVELHGNWLNLVKPLGWIALSLFTASLFLFAVFYMWAKGKANEKCRKADDTTTYGDEIDL